MPTTLLNLDKTSTDIIQNMKFTSHNPDLKDEADRITNETKQCYHNIKVLVETGKSGVDKNSEISKLLTEELKMLDSIKMQATGLLANYMKDTFE